MRSDIPNLELFRLDPESELLLPLLGQPVMAGFPSPADDFIEEVVDLKKELTRHPESTFMGRVKGDSLADLNIEAGDVLIVDKLLRSELRVQEAREKVLKHRHYREKPVLVVCYLDGGYTVKIIKLFPTFCLLLSANNAYKPIRVDEHNQFMLWGVVTWVLKKTY